MQKNFQIKKHQAKGKARIRPESIRLSYESMSKRTSVRASEAEESRSRVQRRVTEIWETVESMGVDISESAIFKYLRKLMDRKCFRFAELILELLKTRSTAKTLSTEGQFPIDPLLYELQKAREGLQQFLWRRFCRDVDILETRISLADEAVRDSLDLGDYQKATCSFRPSLISNPLDLIHEYQGVSSPALPLNPCRLQQLRYLKLSSCSRRVSALHNEICLQKSGAHLFRNG